MKPREDEITLVTAARSLRLGYHATLNAILRGDLLGRQDERGRWLVSSDSVREFDDRRDGGAQ